MCWISRDLKLLCLLMVVYLGTSRNRKNLQGKHLTGDLIAQPCLCS